VLADALTSVLAIVALLAGKYMGLNWMDPIMGIVGALLVARWSVTLIKDTSATLLDHQAPVARRQQVTKAIEAPGDTHVVDLHLWSVGPGIWALELVVVVPQGVTATDIRTRLRHQDAIVHSTIEVQPQRVAEGPL
jgi:cation diffusion facilitator family transporter